MWPFSKKSSAVDPSPANNPGYQHRISRLDSWANFMTGLGYAGYDKRMATSFQPSRILTEQELNDIYRSEGFGWRGIEIFTEDMTKKPFTITGDPKNLLAKEVKRVKVYSKLTEGIRWALLHGGSLGVIGIDDGRFLDEPVDENNIQAVTHIRIFDRWRVTFAPSDLYSDPANPKYGEPEYYTIFPLSIPIVQDYKQHYASLQAQAEKGRMGPSMRDRASYGLAAPISGAFRVHESRVLRFDGKPIPERDRVANSLWNDSYVQGVYDRLRGLGSTFANLEVVIENFAVDVLRIKGLAAMIAGGEDALAVTRLHQIDSTRSALHTLLLDAEEEFQRNFATLTGLPESIDKLILGVCAAWGIPVTRFMGQSPAGLNANGAFDMRMHYDKIASMQKAMLNEPCEKIVKYLMLAKSGVFNGVEIKDWEIEFPSLYELTEEEQAAERKTVAETDAIYIDRGVLDPAEVAISRFGGNKYSMETNIDAGRERKLPGEDEDVKTGSTTE